jgi:hypothetical protein
MPDKSIRNNLDLPLSTDGGNSFYTGLHASLEKIDDAIAKCADASPSDPSSDDDESMGYATRSICITVGHKIFICEDPATGEAVWRQLWPPLMSIEPLSVTNGMLAGSIAFSKLLGSDISITNAQLAGSIAFSKLLGSDISIANSQLAGSIAAGKLTFANTARILGRKTSGSGAGEECTLSDILDMIGSATEGDILRRGASAWERLPLDGWIPSGETWTYASANTFTISGDKTAKYYSGMRLKLTQTTAKFFIVVKVAYSSPNTTITVYGGTDYTIANATITSPYWSMMKTPAGFPADEAKWTIEVSSNIDSTQATPNTSTWYNKGGSITLPIGQWRVSYSALVKVTNDAEDDISLFATLSTANNSESTNRYSRGIYGMWLKANSSAFFSTQMGPEIITVAAATTYYLNIYTDNAGMDSIGVMGSGQTTVIKAVCAYL